MKRIVIFCLLTVLGLRAFANNESDNVVVKTLAGKKMTFKEVVDGDFVAILFWSTTCKPCLNELAALMDIEDKWKGKFRILAVSVDDARSLAKVKSLANGNKWKFEVLLDTNKDLYNIYKLTSIPTSIMLNSRGEVVYRHVGYVPNDENIFVERALKEAEKESK